MNYYCDFSLLFCFPSQDDFASFEWSPCETKILYVAERKVPKSEPFYKPKPQDTKENLESDCEKAAQKVLTKLLTYEY